MAHPLTLYPVETPVGPAWIGLARDEVAWLSLGELNLPAVERYWKGPVQKAEKCPVSDAELKQAAKGGNTLKLAPRGSAFQEAVWKELQRIPFSQTTTYGNIAETLGSANKARAVGSAVGANPIAWLIPCHRVLPSTGGIGSYRWGKMAKKALLEWESRQEDSTGSKPLPETREKLENMLINAQRFEDISRMAGDIAHDLNNLLAPIRMSTQMLKRKLQDASLDRYVEIIETSTGRARDVIQEILSFSREAEGESPEPIDVTPHLVELEAMAAETFPDHIEVQFHNNGQLPLVNMDHNQLHRVILNMLVNARDAIPQDGRVDIHTSIHELDMEICVGEKRLVPGKFVCISISDTGCGIPEDIRDQVFDPFFTTKPKEQGTGLGLASAYGIVARAGGFIDFESEPGKGTSFHVFLPQATDN